jgi:protein-tyrosine phosphatase
MRNWLRDPGSREGERVVVVHCKAGKGRSGTVACSYLISEEGWETEDALNRFTARRMRPGFGNGVSIPSQLRWVGYVDQWTRTGKKYVERQVEILEVHAWGLRDGVKVAIQGYVDGGRTIKTFHIFNKKERLIVEDWRQRPSMFMDLIGAGSDAAVSEIVDPPKPALIATDPPPPGESIPTHAGDEPGGRVVIFRPSGRVILPTSDVCVDIERRNRAPYGWTMVTSVAHVWFNAYFEGLSAASPPSPPRSADDGVFEIVWDAMDGIKGSSQKGMRALDRMAVVWRALDGERDGEGASRVIDQPKLGEPVPEMPPADWKKANEPGEDETRKDLGLRVQSPVGTPSGNVSRASSVRSTQEGRGVAEGEYDESMRGLRSDETDGRNEDRK